MSQMVFDENGNSMDAGRFVSPEPATPQPQGFAQRAQDDRQNAMQARAQSAQNVYGQLMGLGEQFDQADAQAKANDDDWTVAANAMLLGRMGKTSGNDAAGVWDRGKERYGFMDPRMYQALSQGFGVDYAGGVTDGSNTWHFRFKTDANGQRVMDANGNPVRECFKMDTPETMAKRFLNAGMIDQYNKVRDVHLAGKYTPSQLDAMGLPVKNNASGVTIGSGVARKLFGDRFERPNKISTFSADGKGGWAKSFHDSTTGEERYELGGTQLKRAQDEEAARQQAIADAKAKGRGNGLSYDERARLLQEQEAGKNARQQNQIDADRERREAAASAKKDEKSQEREMAEDKEISTWYNRELANISREVAAMNQNPAYKFSDIQEYKEAARKRLDEERDTRIKALEEKRKGGTAKPSAQGGGKPEEDAPSSGGGATSGEEDIRTDDNGVKWRIIYKDGKPVGKTRAK